MSVETRASVETRTLAVIVLPAGVPIFNERAIRIEIEDEAGGEFVILRQDDDGKICVEPSDWPVLRAAIDRMIEECRM
jgi:hypothetical protein